MEPTDFNKGKMTYRFVWSSLDKEEELKQLCRTLTNLVRGCPSPEDFDYRRLSFKVVADLEAKPEYLGSSFSC